VAIAAPPTTPSPPPTPAVKTAAPAAPSVPPAPIRAGIIEDAGVVRRDSVHALRWTSRGPTKVLADADAGEVVLLAGAAVGGAFTADSIRSEGDLEVGGILNVSGALTSTGTLHARGTVHWGEANVRGRARLNGAVRVDRSLTVRGQFAAPSLHAGEFSLDGIAEVEGAVEAEKVTARFHGPSRIGTIQARSVVLSVRSPNPIDTVLGRRPAVRITRIEADTVELDGVDVRFVRAREIVLGRGAHVTEVEGHVVRRHASARVGPESRSPPPHGLSR